MDMKPPHPLWTGGYWKVGLLLYLLVFLIDHLTPRELESQSKSQSKSQTVVWNFGNLISKCRLDRETGSSLHYACGCTSIDCQDLKWRTAEGNCRPISAALHLRGDWAAFFFFFDWLYLKVLSNSGYWKSPKKLHNFRPFIFQK
jgi:hypothetical protein